MRVPVAALTFVSLMVAIGSVGDTSARIVINTRNVTLWQVALAAFLTVLAFFAVLATHELVHLLTHPKQGALSGFSSRRVAAGIRLLRRI